MNLTENIDKRVNWKAVFVYYSIACLFSWPFFWWRDIETESWKEWGVPTFIKTASYMWGPGLSALMCFLFFKKIHKRTITFFGTSVIKSLLFWFLPIIALSVFSFKGNDLWMIPLICFLMILGEELGWRGFLQDSVRELPEFKRYIIIGIFWELWHFTTRVSDGLQPAALLRLGFMMIITIVLSYILGRLADRTKSIIIPVTIHAWIDIIAEFYSPTTLIIFACALPFWTYLILTWDKPLNLRKKIITANNV